LVRLLLLLLLSLSSLLFFTRRTPINQIDQSLPVHSVVNKKVL
jgi:hypothetical protein